MTFYSNLAATAARLLAQFGQDVEVLRVAQGDYSPGTGSAPAPTIGQTFKGAVFDVKAGVKEIRGTLVQADDKQLLLEAAASPTPQDRIRVGETEYGIASVETIGPGGEAVVHQVHLRR